ncbi:MAG: hypothetical protein FWF47_06935 [Clostridia bacterium]|nr:hypothetical protein [Clostridia bacterium]
MELKIKPWRIETTDGSLETKDFRESIFCQANGYMGMRGYAPEDRKVNNYSRAAFLAGFYEYIRPGITDMVNQPDVSSTTLLANGIDISALPKEGFKQVLNMRDGTLYRCYTAEDTQGRKTHVAVTRFLSMARRHVAAFRFEVTSVNHAGTITIETGIDSAVENLPISDNQLNENTETSRLWGEPEVHTGGLYMETVVSKRGVAAEYRVIGNKSAVLNHGETAVLDKIVAIYSFRDEGDPRSMAIQAADTAATFGFDALLAENAEAWDALWNTADIEVDADEALQGAIRYNVFSLIQTAPHNDPHASIGARGLSHGRYKGCTFWDTEIFMLPFYLFTNPATAKNLLLYRYHTMQDAIESASRFSLTGARYSWMASDTGFEQCETWDTGCCEIHITADIAYAFGRYIEVTGDEDFFAQHAAEVYIQTARYWASRFTYDAADDRYNLLFVKGPDEYCGVTNNNLYTVKMAAHNLQLAISAMERMGQGFLNVTDEEINRWREIASKAVVRYDADTCLYHQDDVFHLLEPINPADYKDDNTPLYHRISFDRLQRYQVLKQADVLMLMALFPKNFTDAQKQAAWSHYEPKTLHDSTLSFGAHALMAATLGIAGKAEDYFYKSCFLDLKNVMANTAHEGIHTAALGITWQALIFGFAGLWADGDGLHCDPKLPQWIRGMRFRVFHKGRPCQIRIKHGEEAQINQHIGT